MSYSIMFRIPPNETVYCAVSGIGTLTEAHKLLTLMSNNPYNVNSYFVKVNLNNGSL